MAYNNVHPMGKVANPGNDITLKADLENRYRNSQRYDSWPKVKQNERGRDSN